MKLNYHHRTFRGITNTPNGQVSGDTIFYYSQQGATLQATYQGGSIREGHMLGWVNEDSSLDFAYHHIDIDGHIKNGFCHSIPEMLPDGRICLHESWTWTYGGDGSGTSIVEEPKN